MAIKRRAITIQLNGAEFLELRAGAEARSVSIPGYVRTLCGFEAWIARAREKEGLAHPPSSLPTRALERRAVTIQVTDAEYASLDAASIAAGVSIPQYVRTRCGLEVRWASQPKTEARDHEEDDAWERLRRLGLDPEKYFPRDKEG